MSTNGWEQLDCLYFAEVCRAAVRDLLEAHSFAEIGLTKSGGVIYRCFDLFLQLNYDTNLYPKYAFTAVVGIGDGAYTKHGGVTGVPMWYLLPKDHPYRTKVHWTFVSKEELVRVLGEVETDFLETILVPLLLNRDVLEGLIGSFRSEFYS
jgi:hypothetical protein